MVFSSALPLLCSLPLSRGELAVLYHSNGLGRSLTAALDIASVPCGRRSERLAEGTAKESKGRMRNCRGGPQEMAEGGKKARSPTSTPPSSKTPLRALFNHLSLPPTPLIGPSVTPSPTGMRHRRRRWLPRSTGPSMSSSTLVLKSSQEPFGSASLSGGP